MLRATHQRSIVTQCGYELDKSNAAIKDRMKTAQQSTKQEFKKTVVNSNLKSPGTVNHSIATNHVSLALTKLASSQSHLFKSHFPNVF